MTKKQRTYNGERIVSLVNGAGKTGLPHKKRKGKERKEKKKRK